MFNVHALPVIATLVVVVASTEAAVSFNLCYNKVFVFKHTNAQFIDSMVRRLHSCVRTSKRLKWVYTRANCIILHIIRKVKYTLGEDKGRPIKRHSLHGRFFFQVKQNKILNVSNMKIICVTFVVPCSRVRAQAAQILWILFDLGVLILYIV